MGWKHMLIKSNSGLKVTLSNTATVRWKQRWVESTKPEGVESSRVSVQCHCWKQQWVESTSWLHAKVGWKQYWVFLQCFQPTIAFNPPLLQPPIAFKFQPAIPLTSYFFKLVIAFSTILLSTHYLSTHLLLQDCQRRILREKIIESILQVIKILACQSWTSDGVSCREFQILARIKPMLPWFP